MPSELQALPDDLVAYAWSAPMRDLAAAVGMSDVGLKKLLRGHGVVTPPQGYWNRVHAGRRVPARPRAPARGPGCSDRIRLDPRFAGLIPSAGKFPVNGPFASALVPESLDELRAAVRAGYSCVRVPQLKGGHHPALDDLIRRDARRRERHASDRWAEAPQFDTPYWQRQLRLLNALFLGLARHGGGGSLHDDAGRMEARARVGNTVMTLVLEPAGRFRTEMRAGRQRPASDLPARTPLALLIDGGHGRQPFARHADDDAGTLEQKLPDIAADVITAGEAAFRRGLREQQEWQDKRIRIRAEAETRERAAAEAARGERLAAHATALREADEIRALVTRVSASAGDTASTALAAWSVWALARADTLDPVMSGKMVAEFACVPGLEPDLT